MVTARKTRRDHPIHKRDYILPTPPIAEALTKTNEVVQCGDPGLAFEGLSRSGKTTFLDYLSGEVVDHANRPVPVYRVIASTPKIPTDLRVYEEIYQHAFGTAERETRASDYIHALKRLFTCEARAAFSRDAVLAIDQAGRWPWEHYVWLSDLQNKIADTGTNLVVVLMGHRLQELRMELVKNHHTDVVARYLNQIFEFRSLKGIREITKVLRIYDQQTEYPPGSGVSYTHHFAPNMNLADYGKVLWETFQLHTRRAGGKTPRVWPTAYFTKTIEQLLVGISRRGARSADESLILNALDTAAYLNEFGQKKKGNH